MDRIEKQVWNRIGMYICILKMSYVFKTTFLVLPTFDLSVEEVKSTSVILMYSGESIKCLKDPLVLF
jgi:hypothetical protein